MAASDSVVVSHCTANVSPALSARLKPVVRSSAVRDWLTGVTSRATGLKTRAVPADTKYSELEAFTNENADGAIDGFELTSANDVMALDALEQKRPV